MSDIFYGHKFRISGRKSDLIMAEQSCQYLKEIILIYVLLLKPDKKKVDSFSN